MGKIGFWKVHPIKNEIILTIMRHQGMIRDSDLLRSLQNTYSDITRNMLFKVLFQLEVEGIISVKKVKKNIFNIELKSNAPISHELKMQLGDNQ